MVEWRTARRDGNIEDRRGVRWKNEQGKLKRLEDNMREVGYQRHGKKRPDKSPAWSMFPESSLRPSVRRQTEKSLDKKSIWAGDPDHSDYQTYRKKGREMGDNLTLDKRLRKRK